MIISAEYSIIDNIIGIHNKAINSGGFIFIAASNNIII